MVVADVKMKSSAASISTNPPLDGLDAVAILPSGEPVLKKNGELACALGMIVMPDITIPVNKNTKIATMTEEDTKAFFKPGRRLVVQTIISLQKLKFFDMEFKFINVLHFGTRGFESAPGFLESGFLNCRFLPLSGRQHFSTKESDKVERVVIGRPFPGRFP